MYTSVSTNSHDQARKLTEADWNRRAVEALSLAAMVSFDERASLEEIAFHYGNLARLAKKRDRSSPNGIQRQSIRIV
jgi:hypothetical protein